MATDGKEPPSWCDKTFLETALRNGENDPNISVLSYEIERATASGDNYLSEMFRVHLRISEGNDIHKEVTIIVKCPPKQETTGKMVAEMGVFHREITAFTEVLPKLFRLLEEAAPGKYSPFSATCLYQQDILSKTAIVLEDLKTLGFKMAQRRQGLDIQHCVLVMKTLARFHAASVALHQRNPEFTNQFLERPGTQQAMQREYNQDFLSQSLNSLADEIDTWPDFKEYVARLRALASTAKDKYLDTVKSNPQEFNVLAHGDIWVNNIMFRYDDTTNEPEEVRFVDYQLSQWISPAIDIHYFLYTSLQLDLYEKQDFLIEQYHTELGEVLQLFNLEHLHMSLGELHDILKKKWFYAIFASVGVLPFVLRDPDNAVKLDEIISEEGIASQNMYSGFEIQRAFRKLLPIFAEKGLL